MSDDEATRLFGLLVKFVHATTQAAAAELADHDLTGAQYSLLVEVQRRPGVAQHQIAHRFGVTRGNVSQLVKRLETAGLIVRARQQGTDEITLTPAGRDLLGVLVPAHQRFIDSRFAALEEDERAELTRLLQKLDADGAS